MLYRLRALYLRYAAHHADRLGGFVLPKDRGKPLGHVERIQRGNGSTRVIGWTAAPWVDLSWPGGNQRVDPNVQRPDVMHRHDLPLETGFELEAPEGQRPLILTVPRHDGSTVSLPVSHPSDKPSPAAQRRLMRAFAKDAFRAIPHGLRLIFLRDANARVEIKRTLGLEAVMTGLPIDMRFLGESVPVERSSGSIVIILPVYNAFHLLPEALDRVATHTDLPYHLILVEDASPDPQVRPFLREWIKGREDKVTLIELEENHGFVGAVNRGFAVAEGMSGHVVLLNSDAMVPAGWASRLIAPLEADPGIASVTPMSNDAEIYSIPNICQASKLPVGMVDQIDTVAQDMALPARLPTSPTGVGFCMAMRRKWFDRVPRFDTAFGRGYGEEVDWCQKVRKLGGRHVGVGNLFVEHRGGQSFGGEVKQALVMRANAMIAKRYPAYDVEVQAFIGRDPMRTPRLVLAVARAGFLSPSGLPLYLAHSLGGGAESALNGEIANRTAQGLYALVLRVGGRDRWQLEVHGPGGMTSGATNDLAVIQRILRPIPVLQIIYSCGVGDVDPVGLPGALLSLRPEAANDTLEARVHDFFTISPSYCLVDAQNRFRGPVTSDNTDPAHIHETRFGKKVSLAEWQAAWHPLLQACREITVFSESSRALLLATYPDLDAQIVTRPHRMIAEIRPVTPPPLDQHPRRIAVMGNLNVQKGAKVLCDMGERIARNGGPKVWHFGNIDPSFSLPSTVKLHGSYVQSDIPDLAEKHGISAWVLPSVWPETFSFATHEMLATGLPVYGFDIGAQGEALTRAQNGVPIPFDPDADHAQVILDAIDGRFPSNTPVMDAAQ